MPMISAADDEEDKVLSSMLLEAQRLATEIKTTRSQRTRNPGIYMLQSGTVPESIETKENATECSSVGRSFTGTPEGNGSTKDDCSSKSNQDLAQEMEHDENGQEQARRLFKDDSPIQSLAPDAVAQSRQLLASSVDDEVATSAIQSALDMEVQLKEALHSPWRADQAEVSPVAVEPLSRVFSPMDKKVKPHAKKRSQQISKPTAATDFIKWDKVDFAYEGDEDYVPLKDYSTPKAAKSRIRVEEQEEMHDLTYTANRAAIRRRRKKRRQRLAVMLFVFMLACVYALAKSRANVALESVAVAVRSPDGKNRTETTSTMIASDVAQIPDQDAICKEIIEGFFERSVEVAVSTELHKRPRSLVNRIVKDLFQVKPCKFPFASLFFRRCRSRAVADRRRVHIESAIHNMLQ